MRCEFEQLAQRAARAGVPNPGALMRMTPKEIEWTLTAFGARRRREMERLDDLAWLIGRYAAIGIHAPKRYPKKPDGVKRAPQPMSAEEIKEVFLSMKAG